MIIVSERHENHKSENLNEAYNQNIINLETMDIFYLIMIGLIGCMTRV